MIDIRMSMDIDVYLSIFAENVEFCDRVWVRLAGTSTVVVRVDIDSREFFECR